MVFQIPSTGNPAFGVVVSAGYRPVFCSYICAFGNHLIALGYALTAATVGKDSTTLVVGNSDVNDYNNFIATDTNEADTNSLPVNEDGTNSQSMILGGFVQNQQLYVLTNYGLFFTPSFGLPVVFSFQRYINLVSNLSAANTFSVCSAQDNVYIVTEQRLYRFSGGTLSEIGVKIAPFFQSSTVPSVPTTLLTFYNSVSREFMFYRNEILYVFQETIECFYRRPASFADAASCLGACLTGGFTYYTHFGAANLSLYVEDLNFSRSPAKDESSGTAFATRKCTLHAETGNDIVLTKEISEVSVAADVDSSVSSSNYSSDANTQIQLAWYISKIGVPVTRVTSTSAVWTSVALTNNLSFPRTSYNAINLQLELNGLDGTKPAGRIYLAAVNITKRTNETKR